MIFRRSKRSETMKRLRAEKRYYKAIVDNLIKQEEEKMERAKKVQLMAEMNAYASEL